MDYGKSWIKGNSVDVNGRKLKLAKISKKILLPQKKQQHK